MKIELYGKKCLNHNYAVYSEDFDAPRKYKCMPSETANVIWCDNKGEYQHAWKRDGLWSVPVREIQNMPIAEAMVYLSYHNICSTCGDTMEDSGKTVGFAGHVCDFCYLEYEAEHRNDGNCLMCGYRRDRCCC